MDDCIIAYRILLIAVKAVSAKAMDARFSLAAGESTPGDPTDVISRGAEGQGVYMIG